MAAAADCRSAAVGCRNASEAAAGAAVAALVEAAASVAAADEAVAVALEPGGRLVRDSGATVGSDCGCPGCRVDGRQERGRRGFRSPDPGACRHCWGSGYCAGRAREVERWLRHWDGRAGR